jgi:RNA polymerase sigma-70 factor (ECF subfamily)
MSAPAERTHDAGVDDSALIQRARAGDARAFTELVRRYQRPIYRVAYGLTRSAEDADDLAQETFIRAHRALDTFRIGEPLFPWLSRIAVNLAYSLFRRRRRRPETALEPLVEAGQQWAADDDPVEDVAAARERRAHSRRVRGAVEEHQAILVLRVVQNLSYDDIARTLGIPPGTVMSRLSRARAELKRRMERGPGASSASERRSTS